MGFCFLYKGSKVCSNPCKSVQIRAKTPLKFAKNLQEKVDKCVKKHICRKHKWYNHGNINLLFRH